MRIPMMMKMTQMIQTKLAMMIAMMMIMGIRGRKVRKGSQARSKSIRVKS